MSENRCVCCGEIIPEGSMVCVTCQRKAEREQRHDRVHRKNGKRLGR